MDVANSIDPAPAIGSRTDHTYWSNWHAIHSVQPLSRKPTWYDSVAAHLPPDGARCLEVGAMPGSSLLFFAKERKYLCTGIDFAPEIRTLGSVFNQAGSAATFIHTDFLKWKTDLRFDVVYSMGFVEHFDDFNIVIERHWNLVAPGGVMVLSLPVLSLYQRCVRILLYERNYWNSIKEAHNTSIMSVKALVRSVERLEDSVVLGAGYLRDMQIGFGPGQSGVRPIARFILPVLKQVRRLGRRIVGSNRWCSPEAFVIARRVCDA